MAKKDPKHSSLPTLPVDVKRLPKLGNTIKLSMEDRDFGAKEAAALISHLGVESVESLEASLNFKPWARDGVQVDGEISSTLHSQCPVTLEKVAQQLHTVFKAKFVPPDSKLSKPQLNDEGEMIFDIDSEDIPDIYEGDTLDAWAIAMEYLALEIDYFARAENATFEAPADSQPSEEENVSPFAKLRALKK